MPPPPCHTNLSTYRKLEESQLFFLAVMLSKGSTRCCSSWPLSLDFMAVFWNCCVFEMVGMSICPVMQIREIFHDSLISHKPSVAFHLNGFWSWFSWNGHKTHNNTSHQHLEVVAVVVIIVVSSGELEASIATQLESRGFISRHGNSIV